MSGRGARPRATSASGGSQSGARGTNSGQKWSHPRSASSSRGSSPSPRGGQSPVNRGRQRGRPPKTPNLSPVKRRLSLMEAEDELSPTATASDSSPKSQLKRSGRKHRLPKFTDNPSAPEIVEKGALLGAANPPGGGGDECDTSKTSNGHNDNSCDSSEIKAVGGTKRPLPMSTLGDEDEGEEEDEDGDDSAKRPRLDEETVNKAISSLVKDMVDEVEEDDDDGAMEKSHLVHDNGDLDELKPKTKSANSLERLARLTKVLSENLSQAVKTAEEVIKSVSDLTERMEEAVKVAFATSKETSEELLPAQTSLEVRTVLEEFLHNALEDDNSSIKKVLSDDNSDESMQKTKKQFVLNQVLDVLNKLKEDEVCDESDEFDGAKDDNGIDSVLTAAANHHHHHHHGDNKSNNIVPLNQLQTDMVPVESSVEIESVEENNTAKISSSPKPTCFDKSKLFSEMEDKFAKETHKALKDKRVYKRNNKDEGKENQAFDPSEKIVAMNEPGELDMDDLEAKIEEEEAKLEQEEAARLSVTEDSAAKTASNHTSPSTGGGGSDLAKNLRKIRVRRSRTSSANEGSNHAVPELMNGPAMPTVASSYEHPPKLHREDGSHIRLKVPKSPEKLLSESNSNPNQPLRIVIPKERSVAPSPSSVESGSANRKSLLMTPSSKRAPPKSRSRSALNSTLNPKVMKTFDAYCSTLAFKVGLNKSEAGKHKKLSLGSPGLTGLPKLTINGEVITPGSNNGHASLKTVIRLPKVNVLESSKKSKADDHDLNPADRRKRKRISESNQRNSVSPVSRRDHHLTDSHPLDEYEFESDTRTRTPEGQVLDGNTLAESMVVPEKASSFNIHPERCCSDTCHLCGTKFGTLDTPLHVSQLKTPQIKSFAMEFASVSGDACLCDKCFRYIDRKAKAKNEAAKGKAKAEADRIRACLVRNCNRDVTTNVSKKWLNRLRKRLSKKVALNWERVTKGSAKATFAMCSKHSALVDSYSQCGLCKRKLTVGGICALNMTKDEIMTMNAALRADNIPSELLESSFVCKLCKTFCGIHRQKSVDPEYFKNHKQHKAFYKEHKKKLYGFLGLESDGYSTESQPSPKKIHQVSQSDNPTKITIKTTTLDVVANDRANRKRSKPHKEFASPNSEARIVVETDLHDQKRESTTQTSTSQQSLSVGGTDQGVEKCSVTIQFDLNTKKLWQDLHYPYGNYTSFFRHLILLEKYWRNGDLTLAENASQKASVYVKSVKNRIDAYEGKHKRSDYDLSASTRPDLSVPAAPDSLQVPFSSDSEGSSSEAGGVRSTSSSQSDKKKDDSMILKIPKIPMPGTSNQSQDPDGHRQDRDSGPSPGLPTKIRVRTDLLHLGLVERQEPNLMTSPTKRTDTSFNIADIVATSKPSSSSQGDKNLIQILNDPPVTSKATASSGSGPHLGGTSLIGPSQTSNREIFKSNSTADSGSSAIPLTFNNSIAEVLAAAAKNANKKVDKEANGNKPEVTITTKPMSNRSHPTPTMSPEIPRISDVRSLAKGPSVSSRSPMMTSASPSGGSASVGQGSSSSSKSNNSLNSVTGVSNISRVHPLADMNKLLQSQNPGLAPHIIAQSNLPSGSQGMAPKLGTKVAPKPPGPLPSNVRPVQLSKPTGIQTVNKKSLNTVLDRLSGLKGPANPSPSSPGPSSKSSVPNVASNSNLVQQLQAPPISSLPKPSSSASSSSSPSSSKSKPSMSSVSAASAAAALNPFMAGYGGQMVGQPMVQYPNWAQQAQAQAQAHAQAQATALLMAAGSIPGLSNAQAAAALQEMMKMSLPLQQPATSSAVAAAAAAAARIRAPPPLTHMGRSGTNPKPKSD